LRDGDWPTIGRCEPWSREAWPMPAFVTGSDVPGTPAWRVVCSDDDPNREVETVQISQDEAEGGDGDGSATAAAFYLYGLERDA
jgi:hypothetical protein